MRGELEIALRREREPTEYRRVLDSTLEEVVRLSSITEDLLTLARSDSGAIVAKGQEVDVGEVVQTIAQRLSTTAAEKGTTLALDLASGHRTWADPGLLGQVAWNLIDNAVKFAPSGGTVGVTVVREGDAIVLQVTDDGPGFDGDDPGQVFERFFRADRARTRGEGGTGLGLAIVKAVAEAHEGAVSAENRPQGGASVRFEVPVRSAPDS
jgi:signal transduction histidine kinase